MSLLALSGGDSRAFAAFYDLHAGRVLVFLRRRCGNAEVALDLLSETFAKALERRGQFRGSTLAEEQAWLFSIARSELLHYLRDGAIEDAALQRLGVAVPLLTDPEMERIDELASLPPSAEIERALAWLPATQRRAVEMRVVGELDYDDLAGTLGISPANARTCVSRGLRVLSHLLARPA